MRVPTWSIGFILASVTAGVHAESLSLTCQEIGYASGGLTKQLDLNSNGQVSIDGAPAKNFDFAWNQNVISFGTLGTATFLYAPRVDWSINRITGMLNIRQANNGFVTNASLLCSKSNPMQRRF